MFHQKVCIVIVDDDIEIMRCVGERLVERESIAVLGYASHAQAGLAQTLLLKPDVLLLDIHMPGGDAFETCQEVVQGANNEVKVLFYTGFPCDQYVDLAIAAGAAGVVSKHSESLHDVAIAIRHVHNGGEYYSQELAERLIELKSGEKRSPRSTLSNRDIQVLRLLAEGQGNREVSKDLGVSLRLVEKTIGDMKKKLTLKSTNELLVYGVREGLVPSEHLAPVRRRQP